MCYMLIETIAPVKSIDLKMKTMNVCVYLNALFALEGTYSHCFHF